MYKQCISNNNPPAGQRPTKERMETLASLSASSFSLLISSRSDVGSCGPFRRYRPATIHANLHILYSTCHMVVALCLASLLCKNAPKYTSKGMDYWV